MAPSNEPSRERAVSDEVMEDEPAPASQPETSQEDALKVSTQQTNNSYADLNAETMEQHFEAELHLATTTPLPSGSDHDEDLAGDDNAPLPAPSAMERTAADTQHTQTLESDDKHTEPESQSLESGDKPSKQPSGSSAFSSSQPKRKLAQSDPDDAEDVQERKRPAYFMNPLLYTDGSSSVAQFLADLILEASGHDSRTHVTEASPTIEEADRSENLTEHAEVKIEPLSPTIEEANRSENLTEHVKVKNEPLSPPEYYLPATYFPGFGTTTAPTDTTQIDEATTTLKTEDYQPTGGNTAGPSPAYHFPGFETTSAPIESEDDAAQDRSASDEPEDFQTSGVTLVGYPSSDHSDHATPVSSSAEAEQLEEGNAQDEDPPSPMLGRYVVERPARPQYATWTPPSLLDDNDRNNNNDAQQQQSTDNEPNWVSFEDAQEREEIEAAIALSLKDLPNPPEAYTEEAEEIDEPVDADIQAAIALSLRDLDSPQNAAPEEVEEPADSEAEARALMPPPPHPARPDLTELPISDILPLKWKRNPRYTSPPTQQPTDHDGHTWDQLNRAIEQERQTELLSPPTTQSLAPSPIIESSKLSNSSYPLPSDSPRSPQREERSARAASPPTPSPSRLLPLPSSHLSYHRAAFRPVRSPGNLNLVQQQQQQQQQQGAEKSRRVPRKRAARETTWEGLSEQAREGIRSGLLGSSRLRPSSPELVEQSGSLEQEPLEEEPSWHNEVPTTAEDEEAWLRMAVQESLGEMIEKEKEGEVCGGPAQLQQPRRRLPRPPQAADAAAKSGDEEEEEKRKKKKEEKEDSSDEDHVERYRREKKRLDIDRRCAQQ
ncbi:hypothetical protein K490DRAFT_62669 [Saccharata proteae CBS 121410]|uniref:Uncharacterized protein n=1 Tax=Saccharata proteae CBS 121410 TaxID=1314787 RepID=A0A9P4I050_9PEZI|nr:hypothetical protein K490DRAFT_62669 [Saccharata proteae CBS 121410]